MAAARKRELTTPDLVLLSLLAERPMHGYQANLELVRREVQDWAGISRPQVYYSLEKLASRGLIRATGKRGARGRAGAQRVCDDCQEDAPHWRTLWSAADWTTQRERPPFLTWVALSWQARPGVFEQQLQRRRKFLEKELAREEAVLRSIREEVGHDSMKRCGWSA